jgi:ATP phosphoribosyltransferase
VLYLRDDDIPQVVANGTAALGIVGLNEVAERGCDVDVVTKLGFGGCRISLAIPKADEYQGVEYFQGKRIATSYPAILGKFLREQGVEAEMEVITGSVEIAPAAGIADAIFDIVSSGGTLVTNGLKEVERVFE